MAFDESLYVTAKFNTAGGKALAKQSSPLIIRDTSSGAISRYLEGTHNIEILPGAWIIVALYASGGGGGSSVYSPNYADIKGTDGGNVSLSYAGNKVTAGGGKGGTGGVWGNGSSFSNGAPGAGGRVDLSANYGVFNVIEYANGANAVTGDRWSRQPVAPGSLSVVGDTTAGGQGGWGIGDERWSYGGSGGAGAYIKVKVANPTNAIATLSLVVGPTGRGAPYGNVGGNASGGAAIVIR